MVGSFAQPKGIGPEEAAILIEAEMKARPGLTQRQVAADVGKGLTYVQDLLKALTCARRSGEPFKVDWTRGSPRGLRGELNRAKPETLIEAVLVAIEKAPPKERGRLVAELTNPSKLSGRLVTKSVVENESAARRKEAEQAAAGRHDGGVPLPALWARMVGKIDEWSRGMAQISDDDLHQLADLEGRPLELVVKEVERLNDETHRWLDLLGKSRPNLRVIEGRGRRSA